MVYWPQFCYDCEVGLPEGARALCDTCAEHRADRHDPLDWGQPPKRGEAPIEFCHGAGPEGETVARLEVDPEPLVWRQTVTARAMGMLS